MTPGRQEQTAGEWVGAIEGKVHEAGRRGPDRRILGPDQDSQKRLSANKNYHISMMHHRIVTI